MNLNELLKKHGAHLFYDPDEKVWCLYGTNKDNLYWETDNYEAETLEDAHEAAVEYLTAYHEEEPNG